MEITLQPLTAEDMPLFTAWLNTDYIYKWFCETGEEERADWIAGAKANGTDDKQAHFIVCCGGEKIGYCFYMDIGDYYEEDLGIEVGRNFAYEIAYFIGEKRFLQKGLGKIIIQKLEEKIVEIGGREMLADANEENYPSVKVLLDNGFVKWGEEGFVKRI